MSCTGVSHLLYRFSSTVRFSLRGTCGGAGPSSSVRIRRCCLSFGDYKKIAYILRPNVLRIWENALMFQYAEVSRNECYTIRSMWYESWGLFWRVPCIDPSKFYCHSCPEQGKRKTNLQGIIKIPNLTQAVKKLVDASLIILNKGVEGHHICLLRIRRFVGKIL